MVAKSLVQLKMPADPGAALETGTKQYIDAADALKAPLASPTFTGLVTTAKLVSTPVALTDGANIAVDASLGNHFRVTLGGNRTISAPSNATDGQHIVFEIIQDGTGSRTLTWTSGAAGFSFDTTAPALLTAASSRDFLEFVYNSTANRWRFVAPNNHKASHATGGTDALTPSDIGAQPVDSDLTTIASLTATTDSIIQSKSSAWTTRTPAQFKTDLALTSSDVGLGSVTNDAQVKLSTAATKGDIYVATGSATVVRQAVGGNYDPLIADSAVTNGIRYDLTRGSDLGWTREALGFLCTNNLGVPSGSSGAATLVQTSTTRSIQFLIGKLPNNTSIGAIKLWTSQAMVSGAASIALYGSTTLNSSSWSRLGSNVTCTSTLQAAAGRQSITYSTTTTGDQWIRAEIVLTTAPSTYPGYFVGTLPLVSTVVGGHVFGGTQNATSAPGSTLDPSTSWTDAFPPALALTA